MTEISSDEIDVDNSPHTINASTIPPAKILCLVFERASGGTILSYLDRYLTSPKKLTLTNKFCWTNLLLTFGMLFGGLITLHDHGILHRDLHFNNVLARTNIYETEPPSKQKLEVCVLADLGEGKMIDDAHAEREIVVKESKSARSYMAGEFKPPEIKGRKGWSAKGDVYCLGVMMEKIVEREWERRQDKIRRAESDDGKRTYEHFQVPKAFKVFCQNCKQEDPAKRSTARFAARELEKLSADLERDRCEWVEFRTDDEDDVKEFLY